MNSINGLNQLIRLDLKSNSLEPTKNNKSLSTSFADTINNALERLNSQQINAEKETVKAVVGETPDLHQTIVALQTTEMKFQLALQVRNKLLNAYEEIMRMQV